MDEILKALRRLQASVDYLITQQALNERELFIMSAALDNIAEKVERCNTVMDSAAALLSGLSAEILSLKDDPAAIEALAKRLDDETDELAAAVAANTPAEDDGA